MPNHDELSDPKHAAKSKPVLDAMKAAADLENELAAGDQLQAELRARATEARANAEALYQDAFKDEHDKAHAEAKANHDRHAAHCATERQKMAERAARLPKREDGTVAIEPDQITRLTLDAAVHEVASRAPLVHGHKGYGDKARFGYRITTKCGLSIDTPADELVAVRFAAAPGVAPCPGCANPQTLPVAVSFNPPAKKKPASDEPV